MENDLPEKKIYSKELSIENKINIKRWKKEGKTVKEIAALLSISYGHAYMAIKQLSTTSDIHNRSKCGRKRLLSDDQEMVAINIMKENRFLSLKRCR